jgi:hypothetical protein
MATPSTLFSAVALATVADGGLTAASAQAASGAKLAAAALPVSIEVFAPERGDRAGLGSVGFLRN